MKELTPLLLAESTKDKALRIAVIALPLLPPLAAALGHLTGNGDLEVGGWIVTGAEAIAASLSAAVIVNRSPELISSANIHLGNY